MDGDRTAQALARIDAALARIEAAGRRPEQASAAPSDLAERHDRLREAVSKSLSQLDNLIDGGGA